MSPLDAHVAVWHVLGVVKIDTRVGDLDTATHVADAEKAFAVGVGGAEAVDDQLVIVESGVERLRHAGPNALVVLGKLGVAEADAHAVSIGRIHAEVSPPLGIDSRIITAGRIRRCRLSIGRKLRLLSENVAGPCGRQQYNKHPPVPRHLRRPPISRNESLNRPPPRRRRRRRLIQTSRTNQLANVSPGSVRGPVQFQESKLIRQRVIRSTAGRIASLIQHLQILRVDGQRLIVSVADQFAVADVAASTARRLSSNVTLLIPANGF